MGTLYYGDNLDILRRYLKNETVDLIYLDPPFNSAQNYNAFFQEKDGSATASQIRAFEDTWHWDIETKKAYDTVTEQPGKVSDVMQAFYTFLGGNDMMAYLTMMSSRLVELRRVLKPTGSLYLHCDPTASHYLKLLCDALFGKGNFVDEIIWRRSTRRSSMAKIYRRGHDSILFYTKSENYLFNMQYEEKSETLLRKYTLSDEKGHYQLVPLMVSGKRGGVTGKPWRGTDPNKRGKSGMHWVTIHERLEEYHADGLVVWPDKDDGVPRLKYYLDDNKGVPLSDIWTDIDVINSMAQESLGYPTQKPLALLERIIQVSSNPGDVVLDPFCGCGTTIDAAEKLGRQWIGIDITHLATSLIKSRLRDTYGSKIQIKTVGEPVTANEADKLALDDKYQFQWWALGLVGARPVEQKKGADHGIDGKILFRDDPKAAKPKQIVIQVKGGKTGPKDVRDLRGVLDREKAAIGVLISLQKATSAMEAEAASAGFYVAEGASGFAGRKYPRLQLRTVRQLMDGKGIDRPAIGASFDDTFKKAPQSKKKHGEQKELEV